MRGLEVHPFSEEHLDGAAALLEARHDRHREAEPLLGEGYDYRAEIEALDGATGVAGVRDGKVVAYLLGIPKDETRWGPNIWVEAAGFAAEEPEEIRDLYAAAAETWFSQGHARHYVLVPASDSAAVDAWFRLSFGLQHAHGIVEIPDTEWPSSVRLATTDDIDALVELSPVIVDHQALAPVFGVGLPRETEEEVRAMILDDLDNDALGDFVAEQDGRIVGALQLAPVELSSSHSSLARPPGAALLGWAGTRRDVRGGGAGVALTEACFAWAREQGYTTMVTDWRETNLLSSRFWPRRGFRKSFVRLYRAIP